MTFLKVLAVIFLVLFLLGLIRVGGIAEYSAEGVNVWIKVGGIPIRVIPQKRKKGKKKEKKPKEKKKKEKKPEEETHKTGGTFDLVKRMLPLVGEAAGALKRRIRIDTLDIDFTSAGGVDPARAAMLYGYSNMAAGMILPIFEQNFDLKHYHVHTGVDFQTRETRVYLKGAFSARIGQLVSFAVIFGVKFISAYFGSQKAAKARKG